MPHFVTTLHTTTDLATVWDHLHDFTNAQIWDPGVSRAETLTSGPVTVGTRHLVHARFLVLDVPLEYEVVELEPQRLLRVRAENMAVVSDDTITFERVGDTTAVRYDARLEPRGVARLTGPLLGLAFDRIASAAESGLQDYIDDLDVATTA